MARQTIEDTKLAAADPSSGEIAAPQFSSRRPRSFYDWQWQTRWLIAGLAFPALLYALFSMDLAPLPEIPWWLWFALMAFLPMVFLIVYPLLSRTKPMALDVKGARPVRWMREAGVAVAGVVATLLLLSIASVVYTRLYPGESIDTPYRDMPMSRNYMGVAVWMVFASTIGPVAEEIFFRGFLHNAFRRRMPLLLAILVQCLMFGLYHPYGAIGNSMIVICGVVFTLIYHWRKTLVTPILTHAGFNFVYCLAMVSQMYLHATAPVMGVAGNFDDPACIVVEVSEESGAEKAGLRAGDVITSIDGEPVADFRGLIETIRYYQPGDAVSVTAERDGTEHSFTVVLQERAGP